MTTTMDESKLRSTNTTILKSNITISNKGVETLKEQEQPQQQTRSSPRSNKCLKPTTTMAAPVTKQPVKSSIEITKKLPAKRTVSQPATAADTSAVLNTSATTRSKTTVRVESSPEPDNSAVKKHKRRSSRRLNITNDYSQIDESATVNNTVIEKVHASIIDDSLIDHDDQEQDTSVNKAGRKSSSKKSVPSASTTGAKRKNELNPVVILNRCNVTRSKSATNSSFTNANGIVDWIYFGLS